MFKEKFGPVWFSWQYFDVLIINCWWHVRAFSSAGRTAAARRGMRSRYCQNAEGPKFSSISRSRWTNIDAATRLGRDWPDRARARPLDASLSMLNASEMKYTIIYTKRGKLMFLTGNRKSHYNLNTIDMRTLDEKV